MGWEHSDEHETTHVRVDEQGVHFDVFETNGPHFAGGCSLEEFVPGGEHYQRALRLFGQATAEEIALEAGCALEAVRGRENASRDRSAERATPRPAARRTGRAAALLLGSPTPRRAARRRRSGALALELDRRRRLRAPRLSQ
jgi:hypothetical protein